MAEDKTKGWALSTALTIIMKAAEGGYNKNSLHNELSYLYQELIKLKNDVNSGQ